MSLRPLFFLGVCMITLYFSICLGSDVWHYLSLQKKTNASISQWETVKMGARFALKAEYTFPIEEKIYQGSYLFRPPYYLNEGAAFSALKKKAKEGLEVWYHPKNPSISALEKLFPFGLLVRTFTCYGVLIYFLILNRRLFRT